MTIDATIPTRHNSAGNGAATSFSYTLKIGATSHINIVHTDGDGVETEPVLDTDYTVNGAGDAGGGTVDFPKGGSSYSTLASGEKLAIIYAFPIEQTTDLPDTGRIFNESVEDQLDYITVLNNQHEEKFDRAVLLTDGSILTGLTMPEGADSDARKNKVIAWNDDGDDFELGSSIGTNRGDWAASTAYNARDIAKDTGNGNIYWCNTDHTSSGSLPISSNADVAKWNLLVDAASATASAGAVAYKYEFNDSTSMADPTAGLFRLNHATVGSVTAIAMDDTTNASGNPDISAFLVSLDDGTNTTHYGYMTIRKDNVPATFAVYSITGLTDNSGWVEFAVTHIASNGSWTDEDDAHISFTRSGNRGNDAGLDMTFESTTTDTDQGAGKTWLDNATPASATVFYMDDVDANSTSINSFVDSWDDANSTIKGYIELSKQSDPAVFALYSVTGAVTSASTYSKVTVTYITGAGSFTDADPVNVAFIRAGTKGDPAGLDMLFEDTTTDTDQGASKTWLNHATVASATVLYMDDVDVNSASINSFVDSWDDSTATIQGTVTMKKKADNGVFAIFNVTGAVTSASTYSKVAVTYVTGAGSFTDADPISVQFVRSGDDGAAGGGMANVVEDTTPQLGGDLDLNGNNIDFPTTANISDCLDEDNMATDSATMLATQQSIKAYADTKMVDLVDDTTPQLGAALETNSFAINESEGAAVASATTTDIFGSSDGNTIHITGTTTIGDFTDAAAVGMWRKIIFDGVLTLTHDAAKIVLPGTANITTAAGDFAFVYADTVSLFRVAYFKADGTAVISAGVGTVPIMRVEKSGGQSVNSGSQDPVTGWTEILDTESSFASDKWTPQTAGNYYLSGAVTIASLGDGKTLTVYIEKNDATEARVPYTNGVADTMGGFIGAIIAMNGSTDFVQLAVKHDHGSALSVPANAELTWFQGFKIAE